MIIAGARDFDNYDYLRRQCRAFLSRHGKERRVVIVSGHADGADLLGEKFAIENGLPLEIYPADWEKNWRSVGFRRNELMGDIADALIAFWDGNSHGTKHMIEYASGKGLDVVVCGY